MKISIDVDCTPEEARSFLGLPDLSSVHAVYLDKMKQAIEQSVTPETVVRDWAPFGEAGLSLWRQFATQMGEAAAGRK